MTGLYLGALHFDGDPDALLLAYHRLLERFPPETLVLHICVRQDDGLTVLDACPTKEIFTEFTGGDAFRGAVAGAGLPTPRVEPLGDVHVAHLLKEVGR
jgi:hypothetical protein